MAGFADAQTYSRIVLTNFVGSGSSYSATTNITIAAGTVVQVAGNFVSGDIGISGPNNYAQTMYVTYAEDPFTPTYPSGATWAWENMPILGPCTLTLTAKATDNNHPAAYAVLRFTQTVASPTVPVIGYTRQGKNFVLSWPTNDSTFRLYYATNLSAASWISNPISPTIVSGQYTITNTMTNKFKLYRLKK